MGKFIDLTGEKFGKLTVIKRVERDKNGNALWLCQCECGNKKIVRAERLRSGNTKTCGCSRSQKIGWGKTRLYRIYKAMRSRCYDKKHKSYNGYGGRGIKICDEWLNDSFSFYNWAMANGYNDTLTIDRIDMNGNYEPSNCRWVTIKEQNRNRSNCHFLTYKNETHCMTEWAEILGVPVYKVIKSLQNSGCCF